MRRLRIYEFLPYQIVCEFPQGSSKDKNKGNVNPLPRSGQRMEYFLGNLLIFGGYNPDVGENGYEDDTWRKTCPLFQELWKYNTYSKTWLRYATHEAMPYELASHGMTIHGSYMIVYGGTALPFGEASSNSVHMCHLPSGTWHHVTTQGSIPKPLYGQGICRKDGKLYVVGGTSGQEYSLDVHSLDLHLMNWHYLRPCLNEILPKERYRHEIVEFNDLLIVFGGGTSTRAFALGELPTFDLLTQKWNFIQTTPDPESNSYPLARKCHVVVKYKNYAIVHGGIGFRNATFSEFWRLDLNDFSWSKLPCSTEIPLHFHSAAISENGCLYLFGGIWTDSSRSNKVFKLWIDIPPLLEIAWQALCHYVPNVSTLSSDQLILLGVPLKIVECIKDKFPAFC